MNDKEITALIQGSNPGEGNVVNRLLPMVYDELKKIAHGRLMGERAGHTLNTSALVHEAYLELAKLDRIEWKNSDQFYGIASRIMRHILVDYAVKRNAQKRGGEQDRVTLTESDAVTEVNPADILSVHQALEKLESVDERQVRVVECRYFGGLTIKETARALDVSESTVNRDWRMARAWLNRELSDPETTDGADDG